MVLGVYLSFRILAFPDLTVDGTSPLGSAVAATLIYGGHDPFASSALALVAGLLAGVGTGLLHTRLGINELLAGILMMTAQYSINLQVMGRSNVAILGVGAIFEKSLRALPFGDKTLGYIVVLGILVVAIVLLLAWFFHSHLGLAPWPRPIESIARDRHAGGDSHRPSPNAAAAQQADKQNGSRAC